MKKNFFILLLMVFSLFACSDGDNSPIPPPADVTPDGYVNMTEMCHKDGVLYGFISKYDAAFNATITHYSYNTYTGEVIEGWLPGVASPYKMMSVGDYVLVSESDYVNEGDVNVFLPEGELLHRFTAGVGPRRAVELAGNIYILNEGLWGSNNSSLTRYNPADGSVVNDCFLTANGQSIGDTASDIVVCGDRMFIAVATDKVVWVTDAAASIIKKIEMDGQPRYMASVAGKVYVTLYDGRVARIDVESFDVEGVVSVGRNPEQLCVAAGKLFVANSGGLDYNTAIGYDKTVSVIDIATFKEVVKIDVALNPANILTAADGYVYLVSLGNYGSVPNTLQRINPDTYEVTVLGN